MDVMVVAVALGAGVVAVALILDHARRRAEVEDALASRLASYAGRPVAER